jgi:hypothetical protein
MRFVYAHFPINVNIADGGKTLEVRNFLGISLELPFFYSQIVPANNFFFFDLLLQARRWFAIFLCWKA